MCTTLLLAFAASLQQRQQGWGKKGAMHNPVHSTPPPLQAGESYLRVDISCGSAACPACRPTLPALGAGADHYVIPDARVLEDFLEVFEAPDLANVVFLTSVMRPVSPHRGAGRRQRAEGGRERSELAGQQGCGCSTLIYAPSTPFVAPRPPIITLVSPIPAPLTPARSSWRAATCGAPPDCARCTATSGGTVICLTTCTAWTLRRPPGRARRRRGWTCLRRQTGEK